MSSRVVIWFHVVVFAYGIIFALFIYVAKILLTKGYKKAMKEAFEVAVIFLVIFIIMLVAYYQIVDHIAGDNELARRLISTQVYYAIGIGVLLCAVAGYFHFANKQEQQGMENKEQQNTSDEDEKKSEDNA